MKAFNLKILDSTWRTEESISWKLVLTLKTIFHPVLQDDCLILITVKKKIDDDFII